MLSRFLAKLRKIALDSILASVLSNFVRKAEAELADSNPTTERNSEGEGASVTIQAASRRQAGQCACVYDPQCVCCRQLWDTYETLTPTADYIVYNGHSGLGQAFASSHEGEWRTGQYAIVFMNGCDTYAYIDEALAQAHADVNQTDPNGTKYLDVVSNAMPSYVSSTADENMAIMRGLLSYDAPMTYEEILRNIDPAGLPSSPESTTIHTSRKTI